jgi:hypothetical protein
MVSQLTKRLIAVIDPVLKERGFKRKGSVWSKKRDDLDLLVYLQRNTFSARYYLEVGIQRPSKRLSPPPTIRPSVRSEREYPRIFARAMMLRPRHCGSTTRVTRTRL